MALRGPGGALRPATPLSASSRQGPDILALPQGASQAAQAGAGLSGAKCGAGGAGAATRGELRAQRHPGWLQQSPVLSAPVSLHSVRFVQQKILNLYF